MTYYSCFECSLNKYKNYWNIFIWIFLRNAFSHRQQIYVPNSICSKSIFNISTEAKPIFFSTVENNFSKSVRCALVATANVDAKYTCCRLLCQCASNRFFKQTSRFSAHRLHTCSEFYLNVVHCNLNRLLGQGS